MKRYVVIFLGFLFCTTCFAQSEISPATDLYLLRLDFQREISVLPCDCCSGDIGMEQECKLFQVQVQDILFQRDSSVYDSSSLKKVQYIIVPSNVLKDASSFPQEAYVSATNSCTVLAIVANRMLTEQPDNITGYTGLAHVTGLNKCMKYNFFQRLFLSLGIGEKSIIPNGKEIPAEDFPIVQLILRDIENR